jgi:very-short-patch-repair endonuclease
MKEKAIRIFEYLKELKRISSKVIWDLSSYGYEPIWAHDIPDLFGIKVTYRIENDDSGIWLEVRKQTLPKLTPPPSICQPWIKDDAFKNYLAPPVLENRIQVNGTPDQFLNLSDKPDVLKAFNLYFSEIWKPWSSLYAEKLPAYNLYNKLFEIHSIIKKEGEKVELVLGMGLLVWNCNGQHIRKHLFVSSTHLEFDPQNGVISLRPALDGSQTHFESDVLQEILQREEIKNVSLLLEEVGNIWDIGEISPVLSCVTNLLKESVFNPSMEYKIGFSEKPTVNFAPAFYLRKRGDIAWIKAFETIIQSLKDSDEIPANILALTDATYSSELPLSQRGSTNGGQLAESIDDIIYFPHPSNDAQRKIVNRVSKSHGVLVQGPPGTGKSHTIANLICHFLAIGKRILITSQTPRALQVLKNKIPSEYQGLCVSVLGDDPDSLRNLNEAVQSINEKYANKPDKSTDELQVRELTQQLSEIRKKMAVTQSSILEIAEKQYNTYSFGPYTGSLLELSKAVGTDQDRFSWMPEFEYIPSETPPSSEDVISFFEAAKKMTAEKTKELSQRLPPFDKLPNQDTFNQKVQEYNEAKSLIEKNKDLIAHKHYPLIRRATQLQLDNAYKALRELESRIVLLRLDTQSKWLTNLKKDILIESATKWQALLDETLKLVSFVDNNPNANDLLKSSISNQANIDYLSLLVDVKSALSHCNVKGKFQLSWSFISLEGRRVTKALKQIRFNGQLISTKASAELLRDYLDLVKKISETSRLWNENGQDMPETPWASMAELRNCADKLKSYIETVQFAKIARAAVSEIEATLVPDWLDESAFNLIQELIILGKQNILLDICDAWFYRNQKLIQEIIDGGNVHCRCSEILNAFQNKDTSAYRQAFDLCQTLYKEKQNYEWWKSFLATLTYNKKRFFKFIRDHLNDADIEKHLEEWELAWYNASASAFLKNLFSTDSLPKLQDELVTLHKKEKSILCELGAKKAWSSCIQAMKPDEIQYLRAWAQAIKRIGKGTGKFANKHRRDAQEALNKCRSAIPAWVMPLYRVVESVRIEPQVFDVVIIDEASQSGPDALILTYLGKQCIVVGDSEQIAPESFADREKVYRLIDDFLFDIPHKERYDPETSLYAHAEIRYPETVLLNEHFRCMPEIIQFSNDAFYHGKLECLRQYPPNRLEPVITCHVLDGYREDNRKINKTEAQNLVRRVVDCCADPKYENMSMGIISLVGSEQAKLIDALLRQQLDPQEINSRNIICGDAYSFQGDERDVMFLSMVADANTGTILTKASDGRRINVASSRAREQVWVFHSFQPKDMGDSSYLQKLLTYCLKPKRSIDETDYAAAQNLFESKFEEDVFNILTDKGYNVQPQFKCAGFRIDLVVSGMQGMLAIECDGDLWHGPERLEQDMARQRLLERCGWTFWRIRGGDFYLDSEQALQPLWRLLEEYDIHPCFNEPEDLKEDEEIHEPASQEPIAADKNQPPILKASGGRLDSALSYARARAQQGEFSRKELMASIIAALQKCPNLTCTKDSLVSRVCSELGIIKRAGPRREFSKYVFSALNSLVKQMTIEEYKSKNERIRLNENSIQPSLF